jgi:hypothetical protein
VVPETYQQIWKAPGEERGFHWLDSR